MNVTNTNPPTETFQQVGGGQGFQVIATGDNYIKHLSGTGSTNLANGAVMASFPATEPVVIAPNATVSMFPPA